MCRFWIRDWRGVERGERERKRKRRAVEVKAAKVKSGLEPEPEPDVVEIKADTVWSIISVRSKWHQAWTGVSCRVHLSCSLKSELWPGGRVILVLTLLDGFDFGALPFDLGGAHDETQSVTLQDVWLPDWLDQQWLDGR